MEKLLDNKNIFIDLDFLLFLSKQKATLIKHTGTARSGHDEYEEIVTVNTLIPAHKLKITFPQLCYNYNLLPKNAISKSNIDNNIYENIIKPYFVNDSALFRILAKVI